jgi:hypothetical protein
MNVDQMMARVRAKSGRTGTAKYSSNDVIEDINEAIRKANELVHFRGWKSFCSFAGTANVMNVFDLPVDFEALDRCVVGDNRLDAISYDLLAHFEKCGCDSRDGGVAIDLALRKFYAYNSLISSSVSASLSASLSSSASVCYVNYVAGSELPACGALLIDSEKVYYHSAVLSGTVYTLSGLERGREFTMAAAHSSGAVVTLYNIECHYWARGLELLTIPDVSDMSIGVIAFDDCIDVGTHGYKLVFYDPATGRESATASLPTQTITAHNTAVSFDDVPGDLWNHGWHKRLYRTKANMPAPFYLVPYDFSESSTAYVDYFKDSALTNEYSPYNAQSNYPENFHDAIVQLAIGFALQGIHRYEEASFWEGRGVQGVLAQQDRSWNDGQKFNRVRSGF